ncbi:MAG: PRC-barrel domain-containing protein [Euzebya sp.]
MTLTNLRSLRRRKIVDTATAGTIGRVKGVHIDIAGPSVAAVMIKGRGSGVIPRDSVIGFGPDAVTVPGESVVSQDSPSLPTDADAYGARLLDETGRHLGKVEDLTMDDDGRIVSVTADGTTYERTLLGIGSYAVVVSRD